MTEQDMLEREVDFLVLGAGPAGMTAALTAAIEGLDVLLCEKSAFVGGTGATSAGTLWIPGNTKSRLAGYTDSADAARQYLDTLITSSRAAAARTAFLATGDLAIDYLEKNSAVRFQPAGRHPDYHSDRPGAAISGRAIAPEPFDGRKLGADFERVRPPIREFLVLGGMMVGKADIPRLLNRFGSVGDFLYSGGLFARYLVDRLRFSRGTRLVMGNALVARLFYSIRQRGVEVSFETPLREVIVEAGKVTGAVVDTAKGRMRITARRGVVLATGGIGHSVQLRERSLPMSARARSLACPDNSGDGISAGLAVGARFDGLKDQSAAFWTPVSETMRADGSRGLYPHLSLDRAKPGLLAIDNAGRRFVNEAASYHDFVEAMLRHPDLRAGKPAYLVCSTRFVQRYGLGDIYPGTKNLGHWARQGYVTLAPSIAELADKLVMDAETLNKTIERHDSFARTGVDEDFGKGGTEHNRFSGDPAHGPNPCIGEIGPGPYVAMAVWPAEIASSAGLAADQFGRVLDAKGIPIPGLYACGNDMASIMEGTYPGPGTTLGPGMVFGYRAAMHAAHGSAAE